MMNDSLGMAFGSVTQARNQIGGCLHQSNGCTETQSFNLLQVDARNILIMTTMALAIICNSLRDASYLFATSSINVRNHRDKFTLATEAYAFIQGTGLEITIQRFSLDLNANGIRYEFNKLFKPAS